MKSRYIGNVALWLGTITMLLGTAVLAQAASSTPKGEDEAQKAARLLRDIRSDAVQVRSAAARLSRCTESSSASWMDYDRQWNEIKPAVEEMQIKLARLETMQASITPAQRQEIDQSKLLIGQIQSRTHELRMLLDKPGVQTSDVKFKAYARGLRNEAARLEKTTAS